ncbi:rhamnan synthesis F family protein [Bradyrhizobium liaoningense]|uniref:rhamnosyltransferase WsaF family glycosyltransferase n=1 Tax=Bradyrhizobium liaoningense TaxID=43992 RepID=UPI001BA7B620|nr:rhamnan synthesis F family protein [Bradyrhizobium liaoningense]MBR0904599.1 glycosyltransferase [Bradyrhizobium liaoningense]
MTIGLAVQEKASTEQNALDAYVHIVLCAYEPNRAFFERQIWSIRNQTFQKWTCEVRLDGGTRELSREIAELVSCDARFSLAVNRERLGVYHNFEAGLISAPGAADFIAFCDQDDEWRPEKLADTLNAFRDPAVVLVHSDLEIINADGALLYQSCFVSEKRVLDDFSLAQLLLRNAVTGCACVFRSSLLPSILPFPPQGMAIAFHHDLWVALIATQAGRITVLNQTLVRYRQHGGNVVGLEAAHKRSRKRAPIRLQIRSWIANWRLREMLIKEVLRRNIPVGHPQAEQQRAEIRRWIAAYLVDITLLRRTLLLLARGYPAGDSGLETILGKMVVTIMPFLKLLRSRYSAWKRHGRRAFLFMMAAKRFGLDKDFRKKVSDALVRVVPGNEANRSSLILQRPNGLPRYGEQYLSPFPLTFTALAPRVVIVVPTGRTEYIFGGLTTVFKFGVALAQQGIPVRFLSTDHAMEESDIVALRDFLATRCGQVDSVELIEIASCVGTVVEAHRRDVFVATIWWSARRIFHTLEQNSFATNEFYYLIQDYEPGFYAWSNEFALAESTYRMACRPIVNTTFLADHLLKEAGLQTPVARIFNPEIEWSFFHPAAFEDIKLRRKKRVFFYGRPGTPRNLFDVGVAALRRFISELELGPDDIEVISAGEAHEPVNLGQSVIMQSVGKLDMVEYAKTLRESDIGLSLMLSPHPSYPPFEMAASGLTVVTNNFSTKKMDFGGNMLATMAAPESIVESIKLAWARCNDAAARIAESRIDASRLGRPLRDIIPELASEIRGLLRPSDTEGSDLHICRKTGLHYKIAFGGHEDFTDRRVCLFSHFDVQNKLDKHVLYYLSALADEGFSIVLITSNMELDAESFAAAREICAAVVHRENKGYDFAGWSTAIQVFRGIYKANQILLANDSVYGPMRSLASIFETMERKPCDFWGITESLEVEWHLQSYFLLFTRAAVRAPVFKQFWENVTAISDKTELIHRYEVPLGRIFAETGLRPGALVGLDSLTREVCNPTLSMWREILVKTESPFIKVQLLRDNPLHTNIEGWQDIARQLGYDPKLISQHLDRVRRHRSRHPYANADPDGSNEFALSGNDRPQGAAKRK